MSVDIKGSGKANIQRAHKAHLSAQLRLLEHICLTLVLMYTPQICSERPAVKTVTCNTARLTWEMFAGETDLEDYASSVLGCRHFYITKKGQ